MGFREDFKQGYNDLKRSVSLILGHSFSQWGRYAVAGYDQLGRVYCDKAIVNMASPQKRPIGTRLGRTVFSASHPNSVNEARRRADFYANIHTIDEGMKNLKEKA
ncbi:hypothetical protein ACFLQN_03555 [Candidatus Aenigmatarchaeota archaeon]